MQSALVDDAVAIQELVAMAPTPWWTLFAKGLRGGTLSRKVHQLQPAIDRSRGNSAKALHHQPEQAPQLRRNLRKKPTPWQYKNPGNGAGAAEPKPTSLRGLLPLQKKKEGASIHELLLTH